MSTWRTCRVCKEMDEHARLIKYGARHYAHPKCALDKWGASFFDRLNQWQLGQFPALTAAKAGVLQELINRLEGHA